MLPNFIIIGSQKAGTTSLYHVLRKHPQIFMPKKKELNFFFQEDEFARGLSYYEDYFAPAPEDAIAVGEASPGYICHPEGPDRIHAATPDARLILTLRNPVERAYSQYWDNRRRLSESLTFEETIETALDSTFETGKLGYFSRGTYMQYIERFLARFDRERLLILLFDDLQNNPAEFYRSCFDFLGVDPDYHDAGMERAFNAFAIWNNPAYSWFFKRPHYTRSLPRPARSLMLRGGRKPFKQPPINPATRARLNEFYRPWNQALAEFICRDLSHWDE